jgi:hypothetical protein
MYKCKNCKNITNFIETYQVETIVTIIDEEIKLELSILENKFLKLYLQTKEHKSKIELFLYLINILK